MATLINACWFVFKWCLALVLVFALAVGFYLYNHVDEELRRHVEEKFARHYPKLKVKVRSAARIDGEGIEVRGLSVHQPGAEGPRAELVYIDELMLECDTEIAELLSHEPLIRKVIVRRPSFHSTRRADGAWSSAELLPFPQICKIPPPIFVENGSFEFFDPLRNPTSTFTVRDLNLAITPLPAPADGQPAQFSHSLEGFLTSDRIQRVEFKGRYGDNGCRWEFTGGVEGLDLSPDLHAELPGPAAEQLSALQSLRAPAKFRFAIDQDQARTPAFRYDLNGQLFRARIEDRRLPYPITDVFANVRVTNEGIYIKDLRGRNGQTTLSAKEIWRRGYSDDSPLFANLECDQLVIDNRLLDALPENWRAKWYDYFLAGTVNVRATIAFDGKTWKPQVDLDCLDTSFTYNKFPYRLEGGTGNLRLRNDRVDFWLTAYSGADQVTLKGNVQQLYDNPGLWFELHSDQLAIDQKLLQALPELPRDVVRSLQPHGRFRLTADVRKRPGPNEPLYKRVTIGLDRCSIKFDKFPYPINNVAGTIELVGDTWEFRDLEGNNDTGAVNAYGRLYPTPAGKELELHFVGSHIALEEELQDALPANVQQLWSNLRPRGLVGLTADVRYRVEPKQLSIQVGLMPVADTLSIEPAFLPYRIEGIQGELNYSDGRLTLGRQPNGRLRGKHHGVDLAVRGVCDLQPDGGWQARLQDVAVRRLRADRDLQAALPVSLNQWLRKLDPDTPIDLTGQVTLSGRPGTTPRGEWNMIANLQQAAIHGDLPLTNVNGEAQIRGQYDGAQLNARAELDIDSATCRNFQVSQIRGPLRIENDQVLLGAWADKGIPNQQPRPITARAYGGWLMSDGWIKLGPIPRYGLQMTAGDVDVGQLGREVAVGKQELSGRANAGVNLRGSSEGVHTLTGTGYLRLHDADLYRLPQMIALLNIVSLKPPDTAAFTNSEADFRIDGDHIYFDRVMLAGDAISLKGQGEMSLNTDLAMTFYALVGRDELDVPLIPDLFRAASQQIMLIHVDGKLADPSIRRDPFPGVNQALQQLQAEFSNMQRPAVAAAPPPTRRGPLSRIGEALGTGGAAPPPTTPARPEPSTVTR